MIGSLRGKLIEKRPNQLLVDINGVGYQVQIPLSTFASLGALHSETSLLIHTHVREDQLALYGFESLVQGEKMGFMQGETRFFRFADGETLGEKIIVNEEPLR